MKVKRYVVFLYPSYYPGGGWSDYADSFDNVEEAIAYADTAAENKEVVDLETGEDIYIYPKHRTNE